eukprot:2858739-Amphidinium_carterae.1
MEESEVKSLITLIRETGFDVELVQGLASLYFEPFSCAFPRFLQEAFCCASVRCVTSKSKDVVNGGWVNLGFEFKCLGYA